jgi:hypothetical protein
MRIGISLLVVHGTGPGTTAGTDLTQMLVGNQVGVAGRPLAGNDTAFQGNAGHQDGAAGAAGNVVLNLLNHGIVNAPVLIVQDPKGGKGGHVVGRNGEDANERGIALELHVGID